MDSTGLGVLDPDHPRILARQRRPAVSPFRHAAVAHGRSTDEVIEAGGDAALAFL